MIVFDFGYCGSVELNSTSCQPPRESVLGQRRLKEAARLSNSFSDDVFSARTFGHMQRVPFTKPL